MIRNPKSSKQARGTVDAHRQNLYSKPARSPWPLIAAIGFALFSSVDLISKLLTRIHPLQQFLCFSGLFTCLFALVASRFLGGIEIRSRSAFVSIVLRGVMSVAGLWLTVFALTRLPMSDVYAIRFTTPILVAALSIAVLREGVTKVQWLAIALGFIGVLLIVRPQNKLDAVGILAAFGATVAASASMLMVRHMHLQSSLMADIAIPMLILVAITGAALPGHMVMPSLYEWELYALAGLVLGGARLAVNYAIRLTPSGVVASMQYTQMLWGLLFGVVFFGDLPTTMALTGSALVIVGGRFVLFEKR